MDSQTITVYQRRDASRVVRGHHKHHAESRSYRVAVYPNAILAFAAETDSTIRAAIERIAPEAALGHELAGNPPLPPIRKVSVPAGRIAAMHAPVAPPACAVLAAHPFLTGEQIAAAEVLLQERPPVIPGTRAIVDAMACERWYARVTETMERLGVNSYRAVNEFCDIAGVAD